MSRKKLRSEKGQRYQKPIVRADGWTRFSDILWGNDCGLICGREKRAFEGEAEKWNVLDQESKVVMTLNIPIKSQTNRGRIQYLNKFMVPKMKKYIEENPPKIHEFSPKAALCTDCGYARSITSMCRCKEYLQSEKPIEIRVTVLKDQGDFVLCHAAPGEMLSPAMLLHKQYITGLPEGDDLEEAIDMGSFVDIQMMGDEVRASIARVADIVETEPVEPDEEADPKVVEVDFQEAKED